MASYQGFLLKFFCVVALINVCQVEGQMPSPAEMQKITEWFDQLNHAFQVCRKQLNIMQPNLVAYLTQMQMSPANRHDMGCAAACMSDDMGIMSGNKLDITKLMEVLENTMNHGSPFYETVKKITTKCIKTTASVTDRCDLMTSYFNCLATRFYRMNNGQPFQFGNMG